MNISNETKTEEVLEQLVIKNPKVLSEMILHDKVHTGSLTFQLVQPEADRGKVVTVPFIMEQDFGFSLGNNWGSLVNADLQETASDVLSQFYATATNGASLLTNDISNKYDAQIGFVSKVMSSAVWKGSKMPNFQISLTFVATNRDLNPSEIIKVLASFCLPAPADTRYATTYNDVKSDVASAVNTMKDTVSPAFDGIKKWYSSSELKNNAVVAGATDFVSKVGNYVKTSVVMAPLYYGSTAQVNSEEQWNDVKGAITLQVGNWFRATNLICESISGISFSKEVIAPQPDWVAKTSSSSIYQPSSGVDSTGKKHGFPVFAKCTITLRPNAMITYDDFCNYFILNQGENTKQEDATLVSGGVYQPDDLQQFA